MGHIQRALEVRGFALKLQPMSEDEFLSFDEAERLLRAVAPERRPMLAIALRTGLQLGELLALRWSDVGLVTGSREPWGSRGSAEKKGPGITGA